MRTIKIDNYSCEIPGAWDELTGNHLFIIIKQVFKTPVQNDFLSKLVLSFLNMKVMRRKPVRDPENKNESLYVLHRKGFKNFFVAPWQIAELFPAFNYLFSESGVIDSKLTRNLLPKFTHWFKTYHGPSEKLFNLSFEEYIVAETNYIEFQKTKDITKLDKLIATLYRPRNPEAHPAKLNYRGDLREPFNDFLIDRRAKRFKSLSIEYKYTVFLYYQGCRNFLAIQFPHVFTTPGEDSGSSLGFMGLVDALTDNDVTKADSVRKSYLYDIMVHLEQTVINNEKLKEQLKQNKS